MHLQACFVFQFSEFVFCLFSVCFHTVFVSFRRRISTRFRRVFVMFFYRFRIVSQHVFCQLSFFSDMTTDSQIVSYVFPCCGLLCFRSLLAAFSHHFSFVPNDVFSGRFLSVFHTFFPCFFAFPFCFSSVFRQFWPKFTKRFSDLLSRAACRRGRQGGQTSG